MNRSFVSFAAPAPPRWLVDMQRVTDAAFADRARLDMAAGNAFFTALAEVRERRAREALEREIHCQQATEYIRRAARR